MKVKKGLKVLSPGELREELNRFRVEGGKKGIYVSGIDEFNLHYTMGEGTVTDWVGYPRSGKTIFLQNLLVEASRRHGWRHVLYMPDAGTNIELVSDLISIYIGKKFYGEGERITEKEMERGLEFVDYFFKIITEEDLEARITPKEFWSWVAELKGKLDGIKTGVIDAWKDLKHDLGNFKRDDLWLADVLKFRNALAEREGLHFHTIIHPKTPVNFVPKEPPNDYSAKGGSEWLNFCKNMVVVHRSDLSTNDVEIYVRKIKPRSLGREGLVIMKFDEDSLTYYQEKGKEVVWMNGKRSDVNRVEGERESKWDDVLPF